MISDELNSINEALGKILGKVSPEAAEILRKARRNLDDAADQAREMEARMCPGEVM